MKLLRTLPVTKDELVEEIVSGIVEHARKDEAFVLPKHGLVQGSKFTVFSNEPVKKERIFLERLDREAGVVVLKTTTLQGTTTTSCTIAEKDGGVDVVYEMKSDSFDENKKGPIAAFSKAYYLGRMSDFLQDMQKRIEDRRAGITPEMREAERQKQRDRTPILGIKRRRTRASA